MRNSTVKSKALFLGVDQTGALLRSGRPKPLEAVFLEEGELIPCHLESLTASCLRKTFGWSSIPSSLVIVADCVFGLPLGVRPSFREALVATGEVEGYGRDVARNFFESFERQERLPRREVEVRCRANSVFQTHPFQKNIQTGTFRMWKDLAKEPDWYYFPVLEMGNRHKGVPIYEGYPTLSWRKLFGVPHRTPETLVNLIQVHFPETRVSSSHRSKLTRNPNFADAAVLALSGSRWLSQKNPRFWTQFPAAGKEGWILGAD